MTSKLSLYNGALRLLGERSLLNLSEARESRRVLDDIWDGGAIDYCLEEGFWNFAMRTIKLEYSPSVEPPFGYRYAFDKPTDWIRTNALCSDEFFNSPLTQYVDEAGFWFCDLDTIYVRYVSDDNAYGYDLSIWPQTFVRFVESYLAEQICERLTQNSTKLDGLMKLTRKRVIDARSKDAMNEPAKFMPRGTWTKARMGGRSRRYDRAGN